VSAFVPTDHAPRGCYVDHDGKVRCVYWCPTGGLLEPMRLVVETLERIGGNPGKPAAIQGRKALERWSR
jgi:hypothetical protein